MRPKRYALVPFGRAGYGKSCDGNDHEKLRRLFGEPGIGKPRPSGTALAARPVIPLWKKLAFVAATLLIVLAFLGAGAAFAQIDTRELSAAQKAQLEAAAAQMKVENASGGPTSTVQKVNEWVQVGQGVGAGLASAARELGIVANEFARTPVGQITIALIIFKVAGGDLIQLLCGTLWFIALGSIWFYFYKKLWDPIETATHFDPQTGKRVRIDKRYASLADEDAQGYRLIGVLVLAVGAVVGLGIIFL